MRTLSSSSFADGTLTLDFTDGGNVTTIEAGKPYIIKWTPSEKHIVNPVFQGVTLDTTDRRLSFTLDDTEGQKKGITFCGTYDKISLDAADPSFLYLGAGNKLYYPSSARVFNPFRAYFQLDGLTAGDAHNNARQFVLNFGDGDETGIGHTEITEITERAGAWYTLDGVKHDGQPTKKGLYIHGGRKVVVP